MLVSAALVLGQCGLPRCTTLTTTGNWSGETFVPSVCPMPDGKRPLASAQRPQWPIILQWVRIPNRPPVPEQVSPACYYGVPTNDETLELLAGSWYLRLSPSPSLTRSLTRSLTLTLTLTLNPHQVLLCRRLELVGDVP